MTQNATDRLKSDIKDAIWKFIEDRDKHGGIMLPNNVIIQNIFDEAMRETDLLPKNQKPTEIAETDKGILYYKESDGQRARRLLKNKLGTWKGKQLHEMTDDECYEALRFIQDMTGIYYI